MSIKSRDLSLVFSQDHPDRDPLPIPKTLVPVIVRASKPQSGHAHIEINTRHSYQRALYKFCEEIVWQFEATKNIFSLFHLNYSLGKTAEGGFTFMIEDKFIHVNAVTGIFFDTACDVHCLDKDGNPDFLLYLKAIKGWALIMIQSKFKDPTLEKIEARLTGFCTSYAELLKMSMENSRTLASARLDTLCPKGT